MFNIILYKVYKFYKEFIEKLKKRLINLKLNTLIKKLKRYTTLNNVFINSLKQIIIDIV